MENNPDTSAIPKLTLEEKQLEFEKQKAKLELFKWLIGSVVLVLITTIIDYGFRDRAAGLQEVQQYDKYVTELIILNKEPGQKRMLAQFFAHVTPSTKLKKGWVSYYEEINKEYKIFIAPVLKNDSIAKKELNNLVSKIDSPDFQQAGKIELLKNQIENNQRIINPDIVLPSKIDNRTLDLALDWESKGFSFLLAKDVSNAIRAFQKSEDAYNGFHAVFDIYTYLIKNEAKLKEPNDSFWKTAFHTIATEYSWKMPEEIRMKLIEYSK